VFVLDLASLAPDSLHPFSRADYERLVELGLFHDAHVELLRGVVVSMSPQGPWHAVVAARIHEVLLRVLAGRVFVMSHSPLPLSDDSEPEPDVAVYPPGASVDALPRDALLVVEVSDTSLPKDRGLKRDLYAEAGVPEYWIVSKEDQAVEVCAQPVDGAYRTQQVYRAGGAIRPAAFPDVEIVVAEFLGPA
jgi:Uma2 family endonuclease